MSPSLLKPANHFITGRDETAAGDAHERAGSLAHEVLDGYVRVVALTRHLHKDARTGAATLRLPGQMYDIEAERVARNVERGLILEPYQGSIDWWNAPGRILAAEPCDAEPLTREQRPGALKIIAGTGYDPGSAAFRLHTAINETTHHASAFVRWGHTNPHCDLRQYDGAKDAALVRQAVLEADVIHQHIAPFVLNNTGLRAQSHQLVIRHYHGSSQNGTHLEPMIDRAQGYTLLGARLSLVAEAKAEGLDMHWSPIPVPVARYRALRDAARAQKHLRFNEDPWTPLEGAATPERPLRIAHSPTNERIKGSAILRDVVKGLQAKGVPVVVDYIRNVSLGESLWRKALCDVCFDSFWLGIQGSGLEAGAMEMPVIAGDESVAQLYLDEIGSIPYMFADDANRLAEQIAALAMDGGVRDYEARLVSAYVEGIHDYAAVAARYERTLAKVLKRLDVITAPTDYDRWFATPQAIIGGGTPIRIDKAYADQSPEEIVSREVVADDKRASRKRGRR
jgi:hypothetical protein